MMWSGPAGGRLARWLRGLCLAGIVLNLLLIGVRVLRYPPFFAQPAALVSLVAPVVMLCVYAGVALALTANANPDRQVALRTGTILGLITGALWVVNLAGETFTTLNNAIGLLSTAPFLLGGFALWGVAGFLGVRRTGLFSLGILAAVWGAMVCVLLTITFGFLLVYTSLPWLERDLLNDPDWLLSGWTDLRAFAIANTFFAGFTHLLGALLIGTLAGAIGGVLGLFNKQGEGHDIIDVPGG
jgi:hypothetical protein